MKAKTIEEVIKNRPANGVLERALAEEYKVIFIAFCLAYSLDATFSIHEKQ